MKKTVKKFISMFLTLVLTLTIVLSGGTTAFAFPEGDRVGVHDPSIIKGSDGKYYVFGSHIAQASSTDLKNWTQIGDSEYENLTGNSATGVSPIFGDIQTNLAEAFEWAGYNDGDASGGNYAVWAPDVFYNEDYVWTDANGNATGKKGAYMMYYSASSTWRRSCIGFVISDTIEGPYEKPAYGSSIIVASGFTNSTNASEVITDGNSTRDTRYTNSHVGMLINDGEFDFNSNWVLNDGKTYNVSYAPNAIDPAIITDVDGTTWMVYVI